MKIERLLVTSCFFMGNILSAPELHIDEAEAAEIGDSLKELAKLYPIGMSEKTIAWVNFSFVVGGVFGPKVKAILERPKAPRPRVIPTPIKEMVREAVTDVAPVKTAMDPSTMADPPIEEWEN